MRYTLAALVLAFGCHGAWASDNTPATHKTDSEPEYPAVTEINQLVNSANFIVHVGEDGLCSGTLISLKYRLILTAHHCIDFAIRQVDKDVTEDGEVKTKKVEVFDDVTVEQAYYSGARNVGSATYKAQIIDYDKDHDLGLLQIRADTIPNSLAIKVYADEDGAVERGDAVWAFGNPLGLENSVSFGHLASTTRLFKSRTGADLTFYQTDAGMLTFGNSGGALLKDEYLVGVPDLTVPGTPVSLSVPYTEVQKLLTANCYEEVWNDKPKQSYKDCTDEKKKKADEQDKSVKDLLQQLIDKGKPASDHGPHFIFDESGKVYGVLGVYSEDNYNALMQKVKGCTVDTIDACLAPKPQPAATPQKTEDKSLPQLFQEALTRLLDN